MTIAVILHPFGEKKPAGLARTVYETTRSIIAAAPRNEYLILLKQNHNFPPKFPGTNWRAQILSYKYLWLTTKFRRFKAELCIFFTPVLPFFFRPKRSIVVVCDLAYMHVPDRSFNAMVYHYLLRLINKWSLKRASAIVAISEFTKSEIVKFFSIPEQKIRVIPLGFNKISGNSIRAVNKAQKPYFLFTGVIKERKNVFNLVRAFNEFKRTDAKGINLVIAGQGGGAYHEKILEFVRDENLANSVIFLDHMNDQELAYLYGNAEALIFPSILEGFGMPILEAMDSGLGVISSNQGSMKEVAGDAALLIDPENIYEIASAMKEVLNTDVKRKLIEKGWKRARQFSWEQSAEKYLVLFREFF